MTGIIKRSLIVAGIFASFALCAQQYTFDYLILKRMRTVPKKFELVADEKKPDMRKMRNSHLINSRDPRHKLFMTFDAYPYNPKTGNFTDTTDKLNHSFRMYPSLLEMEVGFRLRQVGLDDDNLRKSVTVHKIREMVYEITADISDSRKVILTVLLRETPHDLTGGVVLEIPSPLLGTMISELKKNLNPDKNYFISEYTSQRVAGPKVHVRMEAMKLGRPVVVNVNHEVKKEE